MCGYVREVVRMIGVMSWACRELGASHSRMHACARAHTRTRAYTHTELDCGAHGTCGVVDGTTQAVCTCRDGYTGDRCDLQWLTRSIVYNEGGPVGAAIPFTSVTQSAQQCEATPNCRYVRVGCAYDRCHVVGP